jgi:hypothetical protein
MKVVLRKITGVLGAIGVGFGMLFQLQHYPGAKVVLISGLVFRVIQFLLTPSGFRTFSPFGSIRNNQSKFVQVFQIIGVALVILSALFRFQHYPGASILNIVGWLVLTITMVIKALQNLQYEPEEIDISEFGKKEL